MSTLAFAVAGLVLAAGCSSTGGAKGATADGVPLVAAGRLKTCTHLPYPPFQFERGGKVVGFDVDLLDLVAKRLGVRQEIVDTPFENIKTGAFLNSGQCDVAAAGMTITAERRKNIDFSVPYFDATQAVVTRKDSGITSLADVKAKKRKLGAQAQTTGEDYADRGGFDPVSFDTSDALLNGLRTGQVAAVIVDYPVARGWLKDPANSGPFHQVDNLHTGEQYGIGVKKGNNKLLAAIDKAITDARADGTYRSLYEKWIGPLPSSGSPGRSIASGEPAPAGSASERS
ncbi:ABC transporter substrate-binding protein [Streptantibioticus cattleyicolor]|nr:ABC transporter substrate-binding protein [Streptantibioticus cattleyicolor]CCB71895.1 putative polar amino acid ABC transporter substrate-binding protein [Streptantibioticus cattleyicolor NRRL 8057 = DSM 46488]